MNSAIPLALAGSLCTATSSMCQRRGARSADATRVDVWLIARLARRPVWLAGLVSQVLGFGFQLASGVTRVPRVPCASRRAVGGRARVVIVC